MGIAERKTRERAGREERIVAAARAVAENEGWDAVTIRRLAKEIEYSQPILYSHFANRDAIVAAVAVEGFKELATVLQDAAGAANGQRESLMDVAMAYFAFAFSRPALYEAMFILPTQLQFAEAETRPELRAGFDAIAAAVSPFCADVEIATETFWAALHGLAELERSGRIRPGMRDKRIALVVQAIVDAGSNAPMRG
ncbi:MULTISPECIES: TetR/AcrR family transcriptional regulator [Rhizobium]|uniref:TetR/AcrR family transcriptional regulator n=1 Tax=Rhizobium leguminosarum TaxID=384 RepID=A0A4Q8Y4L4_RHILE|nr:MULTISPECIES: TetR/AcrR family transcriptional regulator [Rhizobium]KPN24349.1 TetR family transcriptional regulator [Rhizobium brockwellii]MDV4158482.1 TetR/AcrR family transcriptional regulator [Rhizobium brockwellii]NZD48403.1 TetR/AcrR family transcriptional regulator [Rhizobium leguminosarum]QJX04172.1 TetR/AcrR family transcriptional regulator [Rhizobium brockwellii]TAV47505.1 TetR/AcrR family transcriptional regulator [Rhizobium leguminosarum]